MSRYWRVYLVLMMDDFNSLLLTGARVRLRAVDPGDVAKLFRIISNSRAHLETWLPWVEYVQTEDDERHIVDQWTYEMQVRTAIHLCVISEDEIAGVVSTSPIDWVNQRTSIGYWIRPEFIKRGLATESTAVLLCYMFEKLRLHRIFIQAATGNAASNRVIQKIGFRHEGVLRENERVKNLFYDHNIYGMTNEDFKSLKEHLSSFLR